MTYIEIQHALAIEPGTSAFDEENLDDIDEIVSHCAGLVTVDEETQIIRLVHFTTQDYFRRYGTEILASAQQDIATSCLTYLLYDEFGDGWFGEPFYDRRGVILLRVTTPRQDRAQRYPFLTYASKHWPTHALLCGQHNVKKLMMEFVNDDRRVSSAAQVILEVFFSYNIPRAIKRTKIGGPLTAMHFLAYLGHEEMVSELLKSGFEADVQDSIQVAMGSISRPSCRGAAIAVTEQCRHEQPGPSYGA